MLDASVVLKWLLEDPAREPDTDKAQAIVESVARGRLKALQPVHWLVEVAAVCARLAPLTAIRDVGMLAALALPTTDDPHVMQRATSLAIETKQHLFETLYHAVALENDDAWLLTSDERYYEKAKRYGRIATLRDWTAVP